MNRVFARLKVRHLVFSWLAYWTTLGVWALRPAAVALWTLSRDGAHGDANVRFSNTALDLSVTSAGTTIWSTSISTWMLTLAIVVPPILLWACWQFASSSAPAASAVDQTAMLSPGDSLSLRQSERAGDAVPRR